MNWEEFTRCFVETVEEEALAKFGDHSKFAREAWPDHKNPPVLWRTIRNGRSKTGVRDIYTKDMIGMSNALNERLSSLIFAVEEKIRKGWTPKTSQPHTGYASIRKKSEEKTEYKGNNAGKKRRMTELFQVATKILDSGCVLHVIHKEKTKKKGPRK